MARRQKTSTAEDLMDLVAMMPWWAGVVLALIAYIVVHAVAGREVVANTTPGQIHTVVLPTIIKTLASIGQYILPLICLIGAMVSAIRRSKRMTLIKDVATSSTANALEGITWKELEILVGESFRLQGYQVTENHAGGPDGGIDLVLRKGNEKFFVQCKQWKAFTVGVAIVRELYGVMAAERAVGGFVVTSGKFTKDAEEFAKGRNVELIDGPKLMAMIRTAQAARKSPAKAPWPTSPAAPAKPIEAPSPVAAIPTCPVCSKSMVQRTAKKGANAGQSFWGCSGYPSCRGTRPAG
jgi:restriction system protein